MIPQVSWSNLFVMERKSYLCQECREDLELIQGERCDRCSRATREKRCLDCRKWEEQGQKDSLKRNVSLFTYNEKMKEIIAKWKYRGDYVLGQIFQYDLRKGYKQAFHHLKTDVVVVPIPLSEERLMERGFNQAKMLAQFLPIETVEALSRIHGEKQSKKSRKERMTGENPFFIEETINKTVILVDDIYTTGTTLRHAASLLKEHGCPDVYALTLIRG